jgi:hypothetical protein
VLAEFRAYVEELTEKVARGVERGQPVAELRNAITAASLISLTVGGTRSRVERELAALFLQDKPGAMLEGSVASNVQEVFTYLTQRKGKRELPIG